MKIPNETSSIVTELRTEIQAVEEYYHIIESYLSGKEYATADIIQTLRGFKNTLNKISARIFTLYTLRGQKAKITWDPLLTNIDNALEAIQSSSRQPRATIELSLKISEPKIEEVMSYLSTLEESLK